MNTHLPTKAYDRILEQAHRIAERTQRRVEELRQRYEMNDSQENQHETSCPGPADPSGR